MWYVEICTAICTARWLGWNSSLETSSSYRPHHCFAAFLLFSITTHCFVHIFRNGLASLLSSPHHNLSGLLSHCSWERRWWWQGSPLLSSFQYIFLTEVFLIMWFLMLALIRGLLQWLLLIIVYNYTITFPNCVNREENVNRIEKEDTYIFLECRFDVFNSIRMPNSKV